ncbi:MAG: MCE family protein, partial [Planctomycetota bacterium]|nr:MCE family protein [Planctomycetota bacterium]
MAVTGTRYTRAEAIVGAMIAFCGGLFLLMLLLYGNISRFWRGRKEITVVFTQVTALRPDSPVRLNGVEVGRVKTIQILRLSPSDIARLRPAVKLENLRALPLTSEEIQQIRALPEERRLDEAMRRIENRTMIGLTLAVLEE